MSNAAVTSDVSDAIVAKLVADLDPVPVGDSRAPANVGAPALYAVVDHMDGMVRSDLDQAFHRVKHVVQVRSVGATRNAAQYVQDAVRTSLLDGTLTVPGVTFLQVDLEVGGRVSVDNDGDPYSLMVGHDRFAFHFDARG